MTISKQVTNLLKKEQLPFTTVLNSTIHTIPDAAALGIYVYLFSKPEDWIIRVQNIMNEFGMGRDAVVKRLKILRDIGLLIKESIRDSSGRIIYWHTWLLARPRVTSTEPEIAQGLEKQEEVKKETAQPEYWKSRQLEIRNVDTLLLQTKDITNTLVDFDKSTPVKVQFFDNYRDDERFMRFYSAYPRKVNPKRAYKAFTRLKVDDAMLEQILKNVAEKAAQDAQWQDMRYVPHPASYLNAEDFESAPVKVTEKAQEAIYGRGSRYAGGRTEKTPEEARISSERQAEATREYLKSLDDAERLKNMSRSTNQARSFKDILRRVKCV